MGSICVLSSCLPPLLQSIRRAPCPSVVYVKQVRKQADLNSEHIQNLPWLKLHTLLLTSKQVTVTRLYL